MDEVIGIATGRKYRVRSLTFGERNVVLDETHILRESGEMVLKSGRLRAGYLRYGVVEPKLSDKDIDDLPEDEGTQLFFAVKELTERRPLGSSPGPSSPTRESGKPRPESEG